MASFDEEVEAELEQERLANEQSTIVPVNPVVATAPVAQPPVQAEESTDFDTLVNSEIEQERFAGQATPVTPAKPEEPKEPKYITDFRAYGPNKDDEDVRTSLELLTPEERNELLKAQPWVYNKFTPEEQDEIFEESRKSKPITGADIASVAGSLLGSGVDLAKSAVELGLDMANVGIAAPIKQAIKNKSWFEVKGENDILQAAKEKLDDDARNLSSAIPSTIIGTTRMIQKMFGGKDLNSIANPIQRAVATLAPNDIQEYVGQPIPDPNAGQINPWQLIPNTGIIPFDIVTKIASATSDKDAGGIAALDRLNEMLGIQDKEQSRNRDHIRRLYDAEIGAEDWKASNGQKKLSPWSQVAFSDIGQQAILFRERSLLPSVEFIAEHDGISLEQAQEKRNKIAEINAEKATTELTKEWNRDFDPSMEFLGSLFLGDAAFGEAGLALGAGKLSGGLLQKASTLGMTDREVSRYYDALQKLEKAKMIARQRDMSKPSWWGKTAEYVEKKQDEVSAAGQSLFENLPAPVKAAAPLAGKALAKVGLGGVGGGVGALLDPENPSVGMLEGLTLTTALGVAPSVIRSVDRARRMIGAGEGKLFSEVAKSPESSLPARLIFNKATGPVIDYIAENSTALFKSGVNLGALSAVTATLNSDDPEEFNQAVADGFGMGMGFHLAHGITGRIHGKDPAQDLKNRQKRDVEIYEAVKTASPATQGMLEQVSNYQTAIDRVDALVARSESNLEQATAKGDEKETKLAADALKNAMALQKEVLRANVQTRNEYGRSFLSTYADMNRLANGSRRAGQPNINLEILSPEQIIDLHVSENSRQGMTPDEIAAVRAQGESYANERGYFDRARNRAVINAQHVLDRTTLFGESPSDALRHEGSHALDQIPEFQKLNENTDKLLFTKEEKDLQGNVLNRTEGIYDDQKLVDMYFNKYMGDRNQAEKIQFSLQLGLYNPETQQFNIPEIVKYMKSEVRAELSAGSLRSGLGKLMGAEATIANWVGMRQKQNLLARAIQSVTGLGGKPFSSSLLGIDFTPEVIAANKEAIKALADFNGRFDLNPEGTAGREMSEKEIRTNPVLRKRYGLAGGEFQTELKGIVRDANGKIVGTPVRIANPNAAEGNWTFDQAGNRKQTRGYGQVPDEFQGAQIPAGGSLEVYRDFVYEPDGKTPVATETNDLANLETARGDAIRQALTDAIYDDSTTRLTPFSADGLSWSGIMSKSQVQAIKDIPESILPLSIKEKILAFNDTMARGDGSTFDFDYAPRLGRGKKYKGRKSDIYHVIPIGFGFSKAGNFYLRTLSLNAAFRKLKARAKLMDGWLTPWDNDPSMFMKELQEVYLNNTYEKRDGWLGLDPENPTEKTPLAEVKFGRFLDFMNMIGSDTPPNPQRATTPADPSARKRKTKAGAEEEDNQGIDNLWRSFRLDALADYVDTTEQTGRYRIDLDRVYKALMPAEEPAPAQEERRTTPFDGITATYKPSASNAGISFRPSTPTEEYPTSERGFYSGLQKTIDEKMPAKASPQQILSIVNNPQNAKAEEVKWSNLAGFVEGKASVTKQEVLDYLQNEGSVKFEEVNRGGNTINRNKEAIARDIAKEVSEDEAKYAEFIDPEGADNYAELTPEQRLENTLQVGMNDFLEEAQERIDRQEMSSPAGETKYSQYVLPNGENYREVVLTMPTPIPQEAKRITDKYGIPYEKSTMQALRDAGATGEEVVRYQTAVEQASYSPEYTSSHFQDIPNYVAHMRLDERPDAEGRKGLFIEEIQSDRHQQGREKGYDVPEIHYRIFSEEFGAGGKDYLTKEEAESAIPAFAERNGVDPNTLVARGEIYTSGNGVPDAPFRKDWPVQMFKRALRDAIEGDKEWIGWTKGETQAERFDLSKQVQKITSFRNEDGTYNIKGVDTNGDGHDFGTHSIEKLPAVVGKDLAEKIVSEKLPIGVFAGNDLKVGGEGMTGFYDQILPKEIGKYVKKWGARVEEGELDNRQPEDNAYYEDPKPEDFTPIWKIEITPEMRSSIKEGGQIAFMPKSEAREEERTERLPASGAELTASLVASGTSLESFGKGTLIQLAESYGIELPKDATRGEIIDAINERPQPVAAQTQETDIAFMPAAKLDEAYAKAIESGDMEEAQRLVDERAREAGSFAYDVGESSRYFRGISKEEADNIRSGKPLSPSQDLIPFDPEVLEYALGDEYSDMSEKDIDRVIEELIPWYDGSFKSVKNGVNLTTDFDNAKGYGDYVVSIYDHPDIADVSDAHSFAKNAKNLKPTAIYNVETREWSLLPATYDNEGKLIPLSQRFDTSKPDIRFMPYSPELPKTEDGKVDWEGFKTKTMEIAKPLAGLELPLRGQVNEQEIPVANTKADAEKESADIELISTGVEVPESVDEQSVISNAIKVANSQPWRKGRDFKLDMQRRVMDAAEKAGVTISERTAESIEYLARVGLKDALIALEQNPNAIGWYDEKTKQALGVMSLLFPEIATDENARFAFTWALAVTSNGLKVDKNFELAERVYREYRKAGKMPTNIEAGQAQKAINEGLGLFNKLTKEWGVDNTRKFMQTDFSVGEVSRLSKDLSPSGEFADTNVRGSSILGPKIGNGFFSNLYGLFDALTMDRWLVRTWGRWTGTLVELNPELTKQAMDRLQEAVQKLTPEDKKLIEGMIKKDISEVSLEDLSIAIQKASMKPELRDLMNKTETGEELRKSGNGLAKYLDGQKEAPSGPTERNFIREIFGLMLEELKSDPRYAELTMADLQAVLWYAEKRLYETAKVKSEQDNLDSSDADGYEDDEAPDYANAAIGVAREKGVSQKRIDEVLEKIKNERTTTTRPETQEGGGDQSSKQESAGGFTGKEKQKFKQYVAVTAARRNRNGNEKALWSYARGGGKDSGDAGLLKPKSKKNLGVKYISEWKAGRKLATMFRNNGLPPVKFLELDSTDKASAKKFADTLQQSKDASVNGAAVYVYPAEDYQGMKLFISESGQSGFALKPDGDIVSVFSMEKGSGRSIMETAISAGGKKLDAFDTILPEFYGTHGFVEAARIPWNDEFAPEGWDKETFKKFNNGQPDVVMMVLDPKFEGEYEPRADIYVTDYDQAVEMQDSLLRKLNSGAKKKKQ